MHKHWQGRTVAHRAGTVVFVRCGAFSWDLARRREHLRGYRKLVKLEKLQSIFCTIQSCQASGFHGASEQKKTRVLVLYVIKKHIMSANLQQELVFRPEFRTQCIYILTYDKHKYICSPSPLQVPPHFCSLTRYKMPPFPPTFLDGNGCHCCSNR